MSQLKPISTHSIILRSVIILLLSSVLENYQFVVVSPSFNCPKMSDEL